MNQRQAKKLRAIRRREEHDRHQKAVLEYYKTHTANETAKKFGLSTAILNYYCQKHWGMGKRQWQKGHRLKTRRQTHPQMLEIANYRKSHSASDTAEKFGITRGGVDYWFKEVTGVTHREWAAQNKADVSTILDYYETHSARETAEKFQITTTELSYYCQTHWGMSKWEHLRRHSPQDILTYYETHTHAETCQKYDIATSTLSRLIKKHWGMSKEQWLSDRVPPSK